MKPTTILFASAMLSFAVAAPANAQQHDSMKPSSVPGMKMSADDMNMMMSCKRMSRAAMMKNKRCADLMKMHPDMMKMSAADMMKMSECMKMSDSAMMADKRCASMIEMHHKMGARDTNARHNSQGSANASLRAMERANENSALSSTGMMENYPPCTRQRTDRCMQMNERGMRMKAAARSNRR